MRDAGDVLIMDKSLNPTDRKIGVSEGHEFLIFRVVSYIIQHAK